MLKKELKYFNNAYSNTNVKSEHKRLKDFLTRLLEFNSIEDLQEYYYNKSNELDIKFPRLEDELKKENTLEHIKFIVVTNSVNLLHSYNL